MLSTNKLTCLCATKDIYSHKLPWPIPPQLRLSPQVLSRCENSERYGTTGTEAPCEPAQAVVVLLNVRLAHVSR